MPVNTVLIKFLERKLNGFSASYMYKCIFIHVVIKTCFNICFKLMFSLNFVYTLKVKKDMLFEEITFIPLMYMYKYACMFIHCT